MVRGPARRGGARRGRGCPCGPRPRRGVVDPDDIAAQRVATWSGLRREGVMRGVTVEGTTVDRIVYARLADDRRPTSRRVSGRCSTPSCPASGRSASCWSATEDGRVLLCQLTYKQDWDLPGGVVEVGESPQLAVAREVEEELALQLPPAACCSPTGCRRGAGGTTRSAWSSTAASTTRDRSTTSSARSARSGTRRSARSTRSASGARTSPRAGSRPRWPTWPAGGPAYTESGLG